MPRANHPAPHTVPGARVRMICPVRDQVPPEAPAGTDIKPDELMRCWVCGVPLVAAWMTQDGERL